jgi:hypothetical protein
MQQAARYGSGINSITSSAAGSHAETVNPSALAVFRFDRHSNLPPKAARDGGRNSKKGGMRLSVLANVNCATFGDSRTTRSPLPFH